MATPPAQQSLFAIRKPLRSKTPKPEPDPALAAINWKITTTRTRLNNEAIHIRAGASRNRWEDLALDLNQLLHERDHYHEIPTPTELNAEDLT